jgi:nucleoid DNA-binding protein
MTKRDLAVKIAEEVGLTQLATAKVIDKLLAEITETLVRGEVVELRNFGVFKVKQRKERMGRNPRTGEKVPVPSKRVAYFKVGKILKNRLK